MAFPFSEQRELGGPPDKLWVKFSKGLLYDLSAGKHNRRGKVVCCQKSCGSGRTLKKLLTVSVIKGQIVIC